MNSESENNKKRFYEYIEYIHRNNNSRFNFNRFVEAVENNKNKEIEETETYKLLLEMMLDNKTRFKEQFDIGTVLYRGRIINLSDDIYKFSTDSTNLFGLDKYESKEPPLHTSKNGRSNIAGASYLYLSSDRYTAVSECKPLRESFLSVASFKIKREMKIFNLCDDDKIDELQGFAKEKYYSLKLLIELIMRAFYSSVYDIDNGYKVSQYITELVRKHGYDGIAYKSFISNGKNYTIFNCCESNIEFVESEVVQVVAQHIDIISMNDGERIANPNTFHLPPKEQITDLKRYLIEKIDFLTKKNDPEDANNGQT